jgi:hypothetical protein
MLLTSPHFLLNNSGADSAKLQTQPLKFKPFLKKIITTVVVYGTDVSRLNSFELFGEISRNRVLLAQNMLDYICDKLPLMSPASPVKMMLSFLPTRRERCLLSNQQQSIFLR